MNGGIRSIPMRVIRASGTPFERGRIVGAELRDAIEASAAFTLIWASGLGVGRGRLEELLGPYDAAAERTVPDLVEVGAGIAEGSGVDPVALRATVAFEELYALLDPEALRRPVERCTDALLQGPDGPILVHQEQWYAADAGTVALLVDEPSEGIAVVAPVMSPWVPLVGMNAAGSALGAMSLTAADERAGVPRSLVARRGLDDRDDGLGPGGRDDAHEPRARRLGAHRVPRTLRRITEPPRADPGADRRP
jgi:hypothetical protein